MYSIEALERGIEHCKKNINTFEDAIGKERDTIMEYYNMIDVLREKEMAEKALKTVEESLKTDLSKSE